MALLGPAILAEVEKLVEEQHAALPVLPSGERRRCDKQVHLLAPAVKHPNFPPSEHLSLLRAWHA